jgi:hypothetical protein
VNLSVEGNHAEKSDRFGIARWGRADCLGVGDLMNFGIDGYSLNDALILAAHDIIVWTLVGLVVAWRMESEPGVVTHS